MSKQGFRRLILSALVLMGMTYGIFLTRSGPALAPDFPVGGTKSEVVIEIPSGTTGSQIAQILFAQGVVRSFDAFFRVAVADSRSSQIAPGAHRIQLAIPAKEALSQLLDANRIPNLIKINEGAWSSEVFSQLEQQGFSKNEIALARKKILLPSGITGTEGYFFPAQYSFAKGTSALQAMQSMVDRFSQEIGNSGIGAGTKDFTPMQLLTIASLVQAEGDEKDFAKISQVVRNRLQKSMPLQFDTTVQFIKKVRGKIFLSLDSTKIASAYNTYLHYGLPPGPIGNPGRTAMDAAMNPEGGNWIFFITVAPGDTRFTDSDKEFLRWKAEFEKNLKAGMFGVQK